MKLTFTNENLINAYHNKPDLWNTEVNASEEAKELAWRRLCDLFGLSSAGKQRTGVRRFTQASCKNSPPSPNNDPNPRPNQP